MRYVGYQSLRQREFHFRRWATPWHLRAANCWRMSCSDRERPRSRRCKAATPEQLIPSPIDQNRCPHWRNPMDMISPGLIDEPL